MKDKLYIFKGKCVNVVDGDTIDVQLDYGFKTYADKRLRLLDVDTPERGQPLYAEAKQFVIEKVFEMDIYVQTYKSDNFGRYLAKVFFYDDGELKCLNDLLHEEKLLKDNSKWNKEASDEYGKD
ncbi:nuclease [Staphylococcus pseudintermedius]|uniref:thermonuclease family protein n=1 Tax=Staphylococcus pseudintermedius TaxID=283734 RepID=UPI0008063370|nr:thermonuclease family protein [Staphylococcus pseudintermedius]ANQ81918.1 nuclease [Staphylococcus pseudintermedius]EGQ1626032.1 nuclease [Staphylococcus pseudintermedius]EGQ1735228.1 nuclease [Staphylococcus pseudintermedius]EGQ1748232.1 nuclease [Staphylococcus pseudintermedius]EGQ2887628.1 nuclease [Staphylococcus pseudintermedius]